MVCPFLGRWLFGIGFVNGLHGFGCKAVAAEAMAGLGRGVAGSLGVLRPREMAGEGMGPVRRPAKVLVVAAGRSEKRRERERG